MEAMSAATVSMDLDAAAEAPLLLDRLDEVTLESRARVESTLFMQELFRGSWGQGVFGRYVQTTHYVSYLQQLHPIYVALENALGGGYSWAGPFRPMLHELWRSPAIESDLILLSGPEAPQPPPTVASQVYVARLCELVREAPHLLTAHAYVRCSLDVLRGPERLERLSGALGLPKGVGAALYRAVPAEGMLRYRESLENWLEGLGLSEAAIFEVIEEARTAFRLNVLLLDELARGALGMQQAR